MRYPITPVPKPRMTRRDKWAKRKCVVRYWNFKDAVRASRIAIPDHGLHVTFGIPMPKSWPQGKRADKVGKPHQLRPDADNLVKALLDAVLDEDCAVWNIQVTKLWSEEGYIELVDNA